VRSRPGPIVALLLLTLVLAGVLTLQAHLSMRYHRAAAEKVLRDYAMLAADELARRSVNEIGFNGFYLLVGTLRDEAAQGRLPGPPDLCANPDEAIRLASDLVRSTFRYDVASRQLEMAGVEPDGATKAWIDERLSEAAPSVPRDRRYLTRNGAVAGAARSIAFGLARAAAPVLLAGLEAETGAFPPRFAKAVGRGPLFPPSLAHGRVQNDALFLRILDPSGREVFRAGAPKLPDLTVERPFGDDYNGILNGYLIRAAVDPAAANALVIGGLPRSRLPFLLSLLALTAGLVLTALLQLRRERALGELRSEFVSRVSHELRTPLTQIRMFAETLLLNRVRSEEERTRSLQIIDRESRRLGNLVENILRFSRGERGEDRVEVRPLDVVPLVRGLLRDFEPLLAGRSRVVASLPETATALADESALHQVLLNLLDNAAKYGPEGQEIRLEVAAQPGRVRLSVDDQGPGIPPRERERIWGRYYRLPRDRGSAVAGTGIGLAVVRDLARLQRGNVSVEEGSRGGARFVLELEGAP